MKGIHHGLEQGEYPPYLYSLYISVSLFENLSELQTKHCDLIWVSLMFMQS